MLFFAVVFMFKFTCDECAYSKIIFSFSLVCPSLKMIQITHYIYVHFQIFNILLTYFFFLHTLHSSFHPIPSNYSHYSIFRFQEINKVYQAFAQKRSFSRIGLSSRNLRFIYQNKIFNQKKIWCHQFFNENITQCVVISARQDSKFLTSGFPCKYRTES